MLESAQVARTGLERGLAELGALGFVRPPQVLLAEYLRTLTAENVLDAATAEQVSAAYNRVCYSAAGEDDSDVRDAVAALARVAERLAAINPEERRQIASQVSERLELQRPKELERDTQCLGDEPTSAAAAASLPAVSLPQPARRDRSTAVADALDAPAMPPAAKNGRRFVSARVSVELAGIAALVTFFCGYFLRDSTKKIAEAGGGSFASSGPNDLPARDAWQNDRIWLDGVFLRANEAARSKQHDKARLALELGLAYDPNNPTLLNNLASLCLVPDPDGRTNAKRAVELIDRALVRTRHPTLLDTAAEAYFQCGKVAEAIRLEAELLSNIPSWGDGNAEFRQHCEKQLQKFQGADQIRTAAESASEALPPARLGLSGVAKRSRVTGPLATSRAM